MTPEDPILAELALMLAEAETYGEEEHGKLAELFDLVREGLAAIAAKPDITPEEAAQHRATFREAWLKVFEATRAIAEKKDELLVAGANLAESMQPLSMMTLRIAHRIRCAMEDGSFTGTWEQREELLEMAEDIEDRRESFMEYLTAEDIRLLRDEGVL